MEKQTFILSPGEEELRRKNYQLVVDFMTQYPDKFWGNVVSRGAFGDGEITDGKMYTYYECKDGKIALYMEIYNPVGEAPSVSEEQKEKGEI